MDARYRTAALRDARVMLNGTQSARCTLASISNHRGDNGLSMPSRSPVLRAGGVRIGNPGRNARDRRNQVSARSD